MSPRPTSPLRVNADGLDHQSIMALSQATQEELDIKQREKASLNRLKADLKNKKIQCDSKLAKKKREADGTIVQTMELDKKNQMLSNSNRMMSAELSGLRSENERLEAEMEVLRSNFKEVNINYERECADVEKLRRMLFSYRKEITAESRQRDNVQQDLRASRTAQNLMIDRLDDMEKRNRALKSCVADTFNN